MSLLDRLIVMFFTLAIGFVIILASYEIGKKVQYESSKDYKYSLDMGICLKVGYENVYGSVK